MIIGFLHQYLSQFPSETNYPKVMTAASIMTVM